MTFDHRRKRHSLMVYFLLVSLLCGLLPGQAAGVISTSSSDYGSGPRDPWTPSAPLSGVVQGPPGLVTDGDPVATARGEYILTLLERTLGGPLPLGFGRYFASFAGIPPAIHGFYGPFDSPMGANWVHNFLLLLRRSNSDNVRIYYYNGRVIHFRRSGTTWTMIHPAGLASYKGTPYQMVEEGGKLKLIDPEMNLICTFDFQGLPIGGVRGVESIQDRQGNTHRLTYNPDGTLQRVDEDQRLARRRRMPGKIKGKCSLMNSSPCSPVVNS